MPDQFIVAEVSKSWMRGQPISSSPLLSQSFEHVVNVNYERGYKLHSFSVHRIMVAADEMNESIIAVFERRV